MRKITDVNYDINTSNQSDTLRLPDVNNTRNKPIITNQMNLNVPPITRVPPVTFLTPKKYLGKPDQDVKVKRRPEKNITKWSDIGFPLQKCHQDAFGVDENGYVWNPAFAANWLTQADLGLTCYKSS